MSCCGSSTTFTLTSSTTVIYLRMPEWQGESRNISKTVRVFDFMDDADLESVDTGKNNEPITLTGVETACGDNLGLCFPLCFPLCFTKPLSVKFKNIWKIQNAHEEVTITGLGTCINGVYIIRNFHFNSINKVTYTYKWTMELEFVRNI